MKMILKVLTLFTLLGAPSLAGADERKAHSLTVRVNHLRSSRGVVQFLLYNKKGSIPDEKFQRFFRRKVVAITKKSSRVTFKNLPEGTYAVSIHHDENKDGKINKGFILPTEGVGFTNYQKIGLTNRPKFEKASFKVLADTKKRVKIIYF